jgi:predicted metal-dependent phosphoesterase TrpH
MRFDPHVHTRLSYDSSAAVHDVLAAVADAGLDALAVADHDTIEGSLRAAALPPEYGLLGVPGIELSTADGHLLALGVEVYNALPTTGVRNRRARRFTDRGGHPHFAGSDAHVSRTVGQAYTEVDCASRDPPETATGELLDAIRQGRSAAHGSAVTRRRYVGKFATNAGIRTGAGLRAALGRP